MPVERARWVVLKFGGTSVSTPDRWHTIAGVVRERQEEGLRPLVVFSAVRGASDLLHGLTSLPPRDRESILEGLEDLHRPLCLDLEVPWDLVTPTLSEARELAGEIPATGCPPPLTARIMALGERVSTVIAGSALARAGLDPTWVDSRELLESVESDEDDVGRRYLRARCAAVPDGDLAERLAACSGNVLVTQGFVAHRAGGDTVLLGRGGSDTSAAFFAAKLRATRCEIWSDVPGLYSANPRLIPGARLLRHLHYEEAEEIALTGAKVLHSRCIGPLWEQNIPLHLRCTDNPELEGTVIDSQAAGTAARLKAISARSGITLVSMESVGMWHQVGFLADAFACFKRRGLSIDLVATSQTNVTVSLDPLANAIDERVLDDLITDLRTLCVAELIRPCAAVSLVGQHIRSILHKLAPAFEVFEEERIYLLTQAASDLNLTFVVDESQAQRLVRRLHGMLFSATHADATLGPTWQAMTQGAGADAGTEAQPWWHRRRTKLLEVARDGSPVYVYDSRVVTEAANSLTAMPAIDRVFYAIKANPHPQILRRLAEVGIGFECTSSGELDHVRGLLPELDPQRLLFTPNYAPRAEYRDALSVGCHVTLDSLFPLEHWPEEFAGRSLLARLDPGRGHGHHRHVRTAGSRSKFGIQLTEIERLRRLADECGASLVGLHAHIGSGVREEELWQETGEILAEAAAEFPDVTVLNLGGGLGVPERPGQASLDLDRLSDLLAGFREAHPQFSIWLEPGRFLVARAGVLLAKVTQRKDKGGTSYIGVDAGMNSLIRPALYGAFHDIVNLTRLGEPATVVADIVGPICETGDTLGYGRSLPRTEEGDVLLIATAGAYGHSMSSRYNLREPAAELFLE